MDKIKDYAELFDGKNGCLNFYFITREVKDGLSRHAKVADKFCFKGWSVDIDEGLIIYFKEVFKKQFEKTLCNIEYSLDEYNVISDDINNVLYTYSLNGSLIFSEFIKNLENGDGINVLNNISSIRQNLWAYVIKVKVDSRLIYIFRKISQGKIASSESDNVFDKISSYFDSSSAELRISNSDTIAFDNKIDCLYENGEFLIFRKNAFEKIVGLEEEFHLAAKEVVDLISGTNLISGVEILEEKIEKSRFFARTLANVAKKGNHRNLSHGEIDKMREILREFEDKELKVNSDGQILIQDEHDVGYLVKLLNDYYKQGMTTGRYYRTHSGVPVSV